MPIAQMTTQRVLLVADSHGMIDPRILDLAAWSALIVHAGDLGAPSVLEELASSGRPVLAVRGNNDRPDVWRENGGEALHLPETAEIALPGGTLAAIHGHQHNPVGSRHEQLRKRFAKARAIVYGHSHRLVCDLDRKPWVLNPGACGRTRTYGGPSCILLQAEGSTWHAEARRFPLRRR